LKLKQTIYKVMYGNASTSPQKYRNTMKTMDSRSHLGVNRRHSSTMARIYNDGVGVKTRFHVSILLR
jgi:hypothetical protein